MRKTRTSKYSYTHIGKSNHILEWCAGPAFIGYALLSLGYCDSLSLIDINSKAVAAAKYTAQINKLEHCVKTYNAGRISDAGFEDKFDLVVANPPMAPTFEFRNPPGMYQNDRMAYDIGWKFHREFYANIGTHLNKGAKTLIQETRCLADIPFFKEIIHQAGLEYIEALTNNLANEIFYVYAEK